jgi:hypothetical protein
MVLACFSLLASRFYVHVYSSGVSYLAFPESFMFSFAMSKQLDFSVHIFVVLFSPCDHLSFHCKPHLLFCIYAYVDCMT